MINFFDRLYSSINARNSYLEKLKLYSAARFAIRILGNLILPLWFRITRNNVHYKLRGNDTISAKFIVSLTSFPGRIDNVWLVVESLLRQRFKPDMIILWLSIDQFPSLTKLPKSLLQQQNRGLIINLCEGDLKAHKKYYYAMQQYPHDYIITVDDDVIYNTNMLDTLVKLNARYPNTICCNHAYWIGVKHRTILPYRSWKLVRQSLDPNVLIMPIGVGGILYPPNCLNNLVFKSDLFLQTCLFADDIWLNIMTRLKSTLVAKSAYNSSYFPIINTGNVTLSSKNVDGGFNDTQLNAVREYMSINRGIDPFEALLNNDV